MTTRTITILQPCDACEMWAEHGKPIPCPKCGASPWGWVIGVPT